MNHDAQVQEILALYFPPERLKTRAIDTHAWSSDAGFYTLVPQAVVFPEAIHEIQLLFEVAKKHHTSLTFRTGGTSLSGQTVTNGIMVDLSRNWPLVKVENNGETVRVQPGVIGSIVNHSLKRYGRKIGPDPASINAAMMGGILSNNSSGMCCGVKDNSYHTLRHITFVLADGSVFNTENKDDYRRFETDFPGLFKGMAALKARVLGDTALTGKIRSKYKLKNTVGYSLNAFLDFDHPLDILAHLLIGAEGTLGFIAEAVLDTVADKPFKCTGLLFFDSPATACNAVPSLKDSGAEALEFMDRAALRSIEELSGAPEFLKTLPAETSCILCEYQSDTASGLQEKLLSARPRIDALPLTHPSDFTEDPAVQARYWKLRKGMYPSVAAVRKKGTSVMLEDIAVPVERLGDAILDLQKLFEKFGYSDAIVFGHAREGNLHFLVSQSIASPEDIALFGSFNDALADLVIHRYGGALKAEHGTGRQIAPYVEAEWGSHAYQVMKDLKKLLDPDNIVNPGVILNEDPHCHLKDLKSLPVVEEEVDKCVECGYCEHRCPSRNYTLTPRQRIVLRRSLSRLQSSGDTSTYRAILEDYAYDGMDTCAVDGMCALDCPVNINTGELIKRLRRENHSPKANAFALRLAAHFKTVEWMVKAGLRSGNALNAVLGKKAMARLTGSIRKLFPSFPAWPDALSGPVPIRPNSPSDPAAVYFASCITRMMGKDQEKKDSILDTCLRLARKAGIEVLVPAGLNGVCCGQAFSSKGFSAAYALTVNRTLEKVWEWTRQGKIPLVLDVTSCTHSFQHCRPYLEPSNQAKFDRLTIMDSLEFASDVLLPRLTIKKKAAKAAFHPVCSLYKMNLYKNLQLLASKTVEEPLLPLAAGCCGMAGDRGFYYPGLTASATRDEAAEVRRYADQIMKEREPSRETPGPIGCYSTGKTCEMALSESTGQLYRSIFYLLDEVT